MRRTLPTEDEAREILSRRRTRPTPRPAPKAGRALQGLIKDLDGRFGRGAGALERRRHLTERRPRHEHRDDGLQVAEHRRARGADALDAVVEADTTGIVYVATRKDAEAIAAALQERGVAARAYHAGLKSAERGEIQDAFMEDAISVIVATIAFGMGIDKPNVRFVYHHDISDSIDSYYQEIGRAGRDGEPADAMLFYVPEDLKLRRFQSGAGQLVQDEVEQGAIGLLS